MNKQLIILIAAVCLIPNLWAQDKWTIYDNTNANLGLGAFDAVEIDQNGNIWAAAGFAGVAVFDGSTWTRFKSSNSNLASDFTNDIVVDTDNNIWIGTLDGISVYDGNDFVTYDTSNTPMKGSTVYTLRKNNSGDIWIASKNGSFDYQGITVFDGNTWTNLLKSPVQIVGTEFTDFDFTSTDDAWIGSENGIVKYDGSFTFYPQITTGLWSSQSTAIDANGDVWAGGFAGLLKQDGSSWDFTANEEFGFPDNTFYHDIYVDGNHLWMGTSQGFLKYNMNTRNIVANYKSSNSPLTDNCVNDIEMDSDGILWLATTIGVVRFDEDALVSSTDLVENNSIQLYPNPSQDIVNIDINDTSVLPEKIEVVDINGRIVFQNNDFNKQSTRLDLSSLPTGIYVFKAYSKNTISVKKLIIE